MIGGSLTDKRGEIGSLMKSVYLMVGQALGRTNVRSIMEVEEVVHLKFCGFD